MTSEQRKAKAFAEFRAGLTSEVRGGEAEAPKATKAKSVPLASRCAAYHAAARKIVAVEAPMAVLVTDVCGARPGCNAPSFAWWIKAGSIEETGRMLISDDHAWDAQTVDRRIRDACITLCDAYGGQKLGRATR
jgi:hypothetical protein